MSHVRFLGAGGGNVALLPDCMGATTITWIYGAHRLNAPARQYATRERTEYAFGYLRRALARDLAGRGFGIECPDHDKPKRNSLVATLMDLVA